MHIIQHLEFFVMKQLLVSFLRLFYFWIHISFSFSLVYLTSSSATSTIFIEYMQRIKSLTNIDNIQIINDEPTASDRLKKVSSKIGVFSEC
jgi:hypothetical protein